MSDPTDFRGFPRTGLDLLAELGRRDKAWLDANRTTYDADVATPAKAFVVALGDALHEQVSPRLAAVPRTNGSISPINNDIRFAPGAAPYKDHLLLRFWEGDDRRTSPTLYVRVSATDVGFATGCAFSDVERWRAAVGGDDGAALADALHALGRGRALDVVGATRKRVPAPYGADHPRGDLLRHTTFQARWSETAPASITRPAFVGWCARRLVACADVHRWLVAHVD